MQKGGLIELWISLSVLRHIQTSNDKLLMGGARENQRTLPLCFVGQLQRWEHTDDKKMGEQEADER